MTTTTTIVITVSVEVDSATLATWTKYLLTSDEIFRQACTGYWARAIKWDIDHGWLVYDTLGDDASAAGREPRREYALEIWKKPGVPVPPHYYRLNPRAAASTWGIGVLLKGEHWHDQHDGPLVDRILQRTLLGSVKYG
jgi:hypothetical protein